MVNKAEKDRQLMENLDRILEGKEVEIPESTDEETRSALDFARKIAAAKEPPSAEFKNQLKAQIIKSLAEQEKKQATGDFDLISAGVPRRVRWQGTVAALIVVVVLAIILVLTIVFRSSCSVLE